MPPVQPLNLTMSIVNGDVLLTLSTQTVALLV